MIGVRVLCRKVLFTDRFNFLNRVFKKKKKHVFINYFTCHLIDFIRICTFNKPSVADFELRCVIFIGKLNVSYRTNNLLFISV